jgi:hypothetical protein
VAGWEWDDHLNGYLASKPNDFACKCGALHAVPSYSICKCGKIWNSYVIGTGGDNHTASVEKFICREIPVRENVIVASRRTANHLNITETAPPRDRPVVLMYGGGFNPPHEGHVGALADAHRALTSSGYKVDASIVVPTADKLLANKLAPEDRLSLSARAKVVRAAFPEQIDGAPVRVATEPSEEVERRPQKPRRSDLAAWAQRHYPNHTIVNVTGEDAVVPGAPDQHPSLYSGALGSNHGGVSYLTLPRDSETSMSSSKIRAAVSAGLPIPGMTPEAEQAYREELERHRANYRQARTAKEGGCTCWEGYERVPGTKPCADGSCRKKSNRHARGRNRNKAPGSGRSWDNPPKPEKPKPPSDMFFDVKLSPEEISRYPSNAEGDFDWRNASRRRGEKVTRHNLSDPGPLGKGKDDKMPTIKEDLGDEWYRHGPGGKWVARKKTR